MKERMKRVAALLLCLLMAFSLAACGDGGGGTGENIGGTDADTANTPGDTSSADDAAAGSVVADTDEEIYMNNFGEFYELYQSAMEAETVSQRHALLAVAEAKFLEAAGGTPMYGPTAGYWMTRSVYRSTGYAPWRGTMTDYSQQIITNEIITTEDYDYLKELCRDLSGTGTYIEEARKYLTEKGYTFADTYKGTFSDNPTTWNIFTASTSTDSSLVYPTLDYLFAYDAEGQLQPHLATGYEVSDDNTVYTVHIREGLSWVDSQGRKVADLTADDWVASAQHQADVQDYYTLGLYIDGMTAYATGETTDFSTVGVKAIDDYTLQYTLVEPCTYFMSMFQDLTFLPMCRSYFLSQGGAFGIAEYAEASASPSYTYGIDQNHIAYCGQFLCTNLTERNSVNYVLNESYWNADNVSITSIQLSYDDGTDTNRAYTDFMNGDTVQFALRTYHMETAKANGDFDKYAITSETGRATFLLWFNMHRQTFENVADGAAASQKTDEQKEIASAALQNRHFRLALAHSIDRATYISQNVGEDLKSISIRNMLTPGTYVSLEEDATIDINGESTTFPAGTWYGEIVQAQLDADGFPVTVWSEELQDSDGWDAWYNPELAAQELSVAVEEYLAPVYELYFSLFQSESDQEAFHFDPYRNEDLRRFYQEAADFANDPGAVDVELLGDDTVCLRVSEEYLAFAEKNGVTRFVELFWMENAFAADYMAAALMEGGYTRGVLISEDGFIRSLGDAQGAEYALTFTHREENVVSNLASLRFSGMISMVYLRDYPVDNGGSSNYYVYKDGTIRCPYVDPRDGLDRSAIPELAVYSESLSCAELTVLAAPLYIAESFDSELLESLTEAGVLAYYQADGKLCVTGG